MLLTAFIEAVHLIHGHFRMKRPYERFDDTDSCIIRQETLLSWHLDITPKIRILTCDSGNVCDLRLSTTFLQLKLAESDA